MSIHSDIYVSMTTIPSRFKNIFPCIDSLLNQVFLPTKIIINIPLQYDFRFNNYVISEDEIQEFKNRYSHTDKVEVYRCNYDYGPGTKLVGLLKNKIPLDNSFIVLVDDDVVYKNTFLEGFIPYLTENSVASYWVYDYMDLKIGQGVDGFLIHGKLLSKFLKYYKLIKDEPCVNYHDDVYLSFFFQILNIPIQKIDTVETVYSTYNNYDALSTIYGEYSRDNVYLKSMNLLKDYKDKGKFHFLLGKV
jgi:hypothetical protein